VILPSLPPYSIFINRLSSPYPHISLLLPLCSLPSPLTSLPTAPFVSSPLFSSLPLPYIPHFFYPLPFPSSLSFFPFILLHPLSLQVAYPAMSIALGIESPNKIQNTQQAARLPPRLLNQCLRDIFTFLLCESPLVVLVGSMHFADMLSWDVIVNLANIPSMAMIVLTMERVVDIELAKIKFAPDNLRGKSSEIGRLDCFFFSFFFIFYSILFYSILFYSILFYSILFASCGTSLPLILNFDF
jgi:hypothetical protein